MLILRAKDKEDKVVGKVIASCSPLMRSFLAGAVSGTCNTIIYQPLDLVKTRIQSPVALGQRGAGMVSVMGNVVRNESVLGFWKGVVPSLARTVPGIGLYFCSLDTLQSHFGSADPSKLESCMMGASARGISCALMLPFTVIKTRFESGFFGYSSMRHAFVSIYKAEGVKGLFSGLSATLLRDAPFSGIYLVLYTQSRKFANQGEGLNLPSPVVNFSCGIVSGCLAAMIIHPFDVIKTPMQLYPDKFSKFGEVSWHIYQKDGAVGFLRGLTPRILRRSLMAATAWTVYEEVMKQLGLK